MKMLTIGITLCALLLCGCQVVLAPDVHSFQAYDSPGTLTKAQELRIVPAQDPDAVRVLDDPAEVNSFLDILDTAMDTGDWPLCSLPDGAVPLGTITFAQTETLKLGQQPEERQMEALCTLTIYEDLACTTLEAGGVRLTIQLPAPSAAALRAYF